MSNATRALALLAAGLLLLAGRAHAQDQIVFPIQPESKVWIDGTSNKSDWTVHATEVTGFVKMNQDAAAANPGIQEVQLTVPAAKILSQKKLMDRLMHKALKAREHQDIVYELKDAEVSEASGDASGEASGDASEDTSPAFMLQTNGLLTVAGVTREIVVAVQGEALGQGRMRFQGSHTMLMTDYEMKPPTAMFGALHTGNEVVVHFELVVAPEP